MFEKIKRLDLRKISGDIGEMRHFLYAYKQFTIATKRIYAKDTVSGVEVDSKSKLEFILFDYLTHLEGLYIYCIDVIIFYLIKNEHHDLWNVNKFDYVKSFDELSDINLNHKLKFLDEHNYKELGCLINRELRNCIAHHNYMLAPNYNEIYYDLKKKPWKTINLSEIRQMNTNIRKLSEYINNKLLDK